LPFRPAQRSRHFGGHLCLPDLRVRAYRGTMTENNNTDDLITPGSTATGGGTSMDAGGTTEADVTDGADQKLPKIEGDDSEN
jgi:hypothetical protein